MKLDVTKEVRPERTFTAGRPPYARSGYLTGSFRKLWAQCTSSSLEQYLLYPAQGLWRILEFFLNSFEKIYLILIQFCYFTLLSVLTNLVPAVAVRLLSV